MLKPTHYLLSACLAFAVTTLANAATPAVSNVNTTSTNTASTINHPPATDSLQQLRSIQQQIQLDLNQSRQQNEQLQTRLSELNQQTASLQHNQPQSPQDVAQIQQLQAIQLQIQHALVTLSQQNSQLQQRLNQLEQTITQLQATATPQATPPLTLTPTAAVTPTIKPLTEARTPPITHTTALTPNVAQLQPAAEPQATALLTPTLATPITSTTIKPATNTAAPSTMIHTATTAIPTLNIPDHATAASTAAVKTTPVKTTLDTLPTPITTNVHTVPPTTPPPSAVHTHATTQPKAVNQPSRLKTQLEQWAKNPAFMLRLGIGFIAAALLLLIALFWPKRKSREQENIEEVGQAKDSERASVESTETNVSATVEQSGLDADLMNEYDFLNSDTAIPIRLDLARAYIQMGRYQEARDAIEPVFTKGNDAEHQEAQELLQQITYAEQGAAVEA